MQRSAPTLRWDDRTRRAVVVGLPLLVGTAIKLWLALTTYGTNDVRYWNRFMDYIVAHGPVTIYRDIRYYNHPPMISGLLWLLHGLAPHAPNGFPFLIRLPAIVADVVSVLMTYRLVRAAWGERRALFCAACLALSPILIMVSGFHGNTDPVFICLVLVAAERLLIGGSPPTAGAMLGLAVNVKLVPLIVLPAFLFHLRSARARLLFAGAFGAVLALGFGYHLLVAFPFLRRNVLDYAGLQRIWGLSELCAAGFPDITTPRAVSGLKLLIALTIVARELLVWRAGWPAAPAAQARLLLRGIGWAFLMFLLLTPGFGIQYLAWFAVASFLLWPAAAVGYNLLGGAFMFSVYHYWNRGFPWRIADSDVVGAWRAPQALIGRFAWIYLVVCAALLVQRAWWQARGAAVAAPER